MKPKFPSTRNPNDMAKDFVIPGGTETSLFEPNNRAEMEESDVAQHRSTQLETKINADWLVNPRMKRSPPRGRAVKSQFVESIPLGDPRSEGSPQSRPLVQSRARDLSEPPSNSLFLEGPKHRF
jgi:hypothetical protein